MIIDQKISIIVPLFNRVNLIKETIESVLHQTSNSWELVIVDDGSDDGADGVALNYAKLDHRIKFYRRNRNPKGAPTCRNIGVEKATGNFLIFLDSDDLLAPFCVEQRLQTFQEYPEFDFIVFPMAVFHEHPSDAKNIWAAPVPGMTDFEKFLNYTLPWSATSPIWKAESFKKTGGWDESISAGQDLELHVRAISKGLSYYKPDSIFDCFYRTQKEESISLDLFTNDKKIQSWLSLYSKICTFEIFKETGRNKKILFNTIALFAFQNYGLAARFFSPGKFTSFIRRHHLVSFLDSLKFSAFLNMLFMLERLKLRVLGLPLFSRLKNTFLQKIPIDNSGETPSSILIDQKLWDAYYALCRRTG